MMQTSSESQTDLRVLITGGENPLARSLSSFLTLAADDLGITPVIRLPESQWLAVADPDQVFSAVAELKPHIIFNTAEVASLAGCERDSDVAKRGNAVSPAFLAIAAQAWGAWLVQFSSCYVFQGNAGPYSVTDETFPVQWYGLTKALGETVIRQLAPERSTILRLGWLYGRGVDSPMVNVISGLSKGAPRDQAGALSYLPHVSFRVVSNLFGGRLLGTPGTFHIAPTDGNQITWYDALRSHFPDLKVTDHYASAKQRAATEATLPRKVGMRPSFWWGLPSPTVGIEDYRIDMFDSDESNDWILWSQDWGTRP